MGLRLTKAIGIGAALLAASGSLAACGSDNGAGDSQKAETAAVRAVLSDLQASSRNGDGKRICNQIFTPRLSDLVRTSSSTGSCAKEVRENLFSSKASFRVNRISVTDASDAMATVRESSGKTSNVFFVRRGQRWLIRSVLPA